VVFNENSDGDLLYLWSYDQNTAGPWSEVGALPMGGAATFSPQDRRVYTLVAVDPTWCGANDPGDNSCWRWNVNVEGDTTTPGPAVEFTVS
jgi:hypothetical protein